MKHRQVGAACSRDGLPLGRGLPLGGGLPLGPGKAGPETRFRERAVGPVPTEALALPSGRKDVNVTSSPAL